MAMNVLKKAYFVVIHTKSPFGLVVRADLTQPIPSFRLLTLPRNSSIVPAAPHLGFSNGGLGLTARVLIP